MMRLCKAWIAAIAAALLLVSCGSGNKEEKVSLSVDGCWELTSVTTKSATVGSETVSVFIEFSSGAFTLYQKIGQGRYTVFTGFYYLSEKDQTLIGTYADGTAWGPYEVACSDANMSLTKDSETDTYKKIEAIPAAVASNTY